jgi:hypothetical protein
VFMGKRHVHKMIVCEHEDGKRRLRARRVVLPSGRGATVSFVWQWTDHL